MAFWSNWFGRGDRSAPQASSGFQPAGGTTVIVTPEQLEEALRTGNTSEAGIDVTPDRAMRAAAVYASVRIISGAVATLPLDIKRRKGDIREDASDTRLWKVLRRKPNGWQTPSQFKRMMQAHLLLRGDAYALIVSSVSKEVQQLIPMHPDRVRCTQNDDLSLSYTYTSKTGRTVQLKQSEVFHLVGLTLDGVHGVSVLTYARESIGENLAMMGYGAKVFKNGARPSGALSTEGKLSDESYDRLKSSIEEYRAEGEREGKVMILEEGLKFEQIAMTAADAEWVDSRKFSRTEIAMFFGVPPSMLGDNSGSDSNWGTGLEQKSNGFVAYTLEDHLTTWEETIFRDLIVDEASNLYARFNRAALVRGDIKTRWGAYVQSLQWGVFSPNEVRALEDMNPRDGGDIYYPPPNTAGKQDTKEPDNDAQNAA
ncbi:phage portal protein